MPYRSWIRPPARWLRSPPTLGSYHCGSVQEFTHLPCGPDLPRMRLHFVDKAVEPLIRRHHRLRVQRVDTHSERSQISFARASALAATAVHAPVPLFRASPSLGCSSIGSRPSRFRVSVLSKTSPPRDPRGMRGPILRPLRQYMTAAPEHPTRRLSHAGTPGGGLLR